MAGKRQAGYQVTQDNWDDENIEEEAGSFKVADTKVLAKRQIKIARRRVANNSSNPSPFTAFKGFSSKPVSSPSSGFQLTTSATPALISTTSEVGLQPSSTESDFVFGAKQKSETGDKEKTVVNGGSEPKLAPAKEYAAKIKSLNLAVSAWIQKHLNVTPVCDLSPIFKDYSKHFAEIERNHGPGAFTLGIKNKTSSDTELLQDFKFSTSSKSDSKSIQSNKAPENSQTVTERSMFKFGPSATDNQGSKTEEGNTDEPPKVEFKPVQEKDAVFSMRAKLYYKKDASYREKGVGMVYLKNSNGARQLLMRADTSLGNIILNIGVSENLPAQRQGKNNVLVMAPLNPPSDKLCPQCNKKYPNPQTSNICESKCQPSVSAILIRVKTGDDADQLLEEIIKLKK